MDGNQTDLTAYLVPQQMAQLMPMYALITPTGHIREAGPTLLKLNGGVPMAGMRFLDAFELTRPRSVDSMADFQSLAGRRLHLLLRSARNTPLRGLGVPLGDGQGMLVNLSFGIGLTDAVRDHALTSTDFAATDLAVELLYLQEAKSAVMGELGQLNRRLELARAAAEEQALTDPLTGLANRRALEAALSRAVETACRGGQPFAMVHMDLDFFKAVNDTLGHAAGDFVLVEVARILREETRRQDVVARVGGDEFVMILRGMTDAGQLRALAERIIRKFEQPMPFDGKTCRISGSAGVVISPLYDVPDADRMLSDADLALYASKHRGRACCTMFTPGMDLPEEKRAKPEQALAKAAKAKMRAAARKKRNAAALVKPVDGGAV